MNDFKFEHEMAMAMAERTIIRLWVLCIILIICLIGSNIAWVCYESQWEVTESTQEVKQDIETGDGDLGTVIGIGDNYGKDTSNSKENN